MRNLLLIVASLSLIVFEGGCAAGPLAPPFGLGPGLDEAVFWGLILVAAVFLWPRAQRYFRKNPGASMPNQSKPGMDTAAERYAKGEISREEYLKMVEDFCRGTA
jgi:uncharacterized membrane protein